MNQTLECLMRAGYGARSVVYLIVGAIAVFAAINGGEAEGSQGALEYLARQPFGTVLLALVAAGLLAYTAWRFVDAAFDLENEGGVAKGRTARLGQFLSGAVHAFLAASALAIIAKGAASGGDNSAENWSAAIMNEPFGRWAVAAAGAVTVGVGVYLFVKAWRASYKSKIRITGATRVLSPLLRFGLVAHGAVLLIIGGLLAYAAWTTNPEHAAGLGEALQILETQPFGRTLLGLAGAGMICFAVYCAVLARYRIVPKITTGDLPTLATAVR